MQVKFTVATAVDESNQGQMTNLVESLFSGLLEGTVTFMAGTIQVVATAQQATAIQSAAEAMGIAASVKPTS